MAPDSGRDNGMLAIPKKPFDLPAYLAAMGRETQRARAQRGLSRGELARLACVHENTVGVLERGTHDLNSSTRCRILAALGTRSLVIEDGWDRIELGGEQESFQRSDILTMQDASVVLIIGSKIRAARMAHGATLEEAAAAGGMHPNTLWNIESGLVSPQSHTLHRLYRALRVYRATPMPPNDLFLEFAEGDAE